MVVSFLSSYMMMGIDSVCKLKLTCLYDPPTQFVYAWTVSLSTVPTKILTDFSRSVLNYE